MCSVKLSILILAYNHEKYIVEALDSIKNQIKPFSYEILVGEDCSSDGTRKALESYDFTGLSNVRLFCRDENLGMMNNLLDLCEKAVGEYIIILEGDDFWITPNKLIRQITFLDENQDFIAVAHKCQVVNEKSEYLSYDYSGECYKDEYTFKEFRSGTLPGQTASLMYRNFYKNSEIGKKLEVIYDYPGDRRIAFLLVFHGRIRCWNEKMSAYRHVLSGGSSFTATFSGNKKYLKAELEFYRAINSYCDKVLISEDVKRMVKQCYYKVLFADCLRTNPLENRRESLKAFLSEDYKMSILSWIIWCSIRCPIKKVKKMCRLRKECKEQKKGNKIQ